MPDAATRRRLAFILYLYRIGTEQARQPEPLSATAILTFHDAVELLLALACEQRNQRKKTIGFEEYFKTLDPLLPPPGVPEREAMMRLNSARIALKHHGTLPSQLAIDGFRDDVDSFFEANLPLLFNVGMAEISLAHLVSLPAAREALLLADKAIEERRPEDALFQLALGFAHVLHAHRIMGETHFDFELQSLGYGAEDHEVRVIGQVLRRTVETIKKLELQVGMLRSGVDPRRLAVFRGLTPTVRFAMAGNALIQGPSKQNPTDQEVQFCYGFVIDSVLRIQQSEAVIEPFLQEQRRRYLT